jgi:hypothetical protein
MAFSDLVAAADRAVQGILGGVTVTWQSDEWGDALVPGMFDEAFVLSDAGEAGVESVGPVFFARVSDLPADPRRDEDARLIIGEKRYRIHRREADGMGGVRLLLHRIELDADE